jgi:hypothetical protein
MNPLLPRPDFSDNFEKMVRIDSTPKVSQKGMVEVKLENDSETCEEGK